MTHAKQHVPEAPPAPESGHPHAAHHASGFYGLGIAPRLLEAIEKVGFTEPTPVQRQAIPIAMEGNDLIGIAQTGTGKTLAFGVPMIQRLAQLKGKGLVLLPTRELALQVDEMLHAVGRAVGLRTAVLIGGLSQEPQLASIRRNPHIVVATPGRLIDHLEQKNLSLGDVQILILDEADRMLDMGFLPQLKRILQLLPRNRQTMLFSATMPPDILRIASAYMRTPVRTEIARSGTAAEGVTHELFVVEPHDKMRLLEQLLSEYRGTVLVFTRTKFGAKKVCRALKYLNVAAAEIHSNRSLVQRRDALEGFKAGKYRVLVATDIASRGIDVAGIELVVNFDVPKNPGDYIHRIGRTGRAGLSGRAISFATKDQGKEVREIEKLARIMLPISALPELPPARAETRESWRPARISSRPWGTRPARPGGSPHRPMHRRSQPRR